MSPCLARHLATLFIVHYFYPSLECLLTSRIPRGQESSPLLDASSPSCWRSVNMLLPWHVFLNVLPSPSNQPSLKSTHTFAISFSVLDTIWAWKFKVIFNLSSVNPQLVLLFFLVAPYILKCTNQSSPGTLLWSHWVRLISLAVARKSTPRNISEAILWVHWDRPLLGFGLVVGGTESGLGKWRSVLGWML